MLTAALVASANEVSDPSTILLTVDPTGTTAIGGTAVAASSDGRFVLLYTNEQMVAGTEANLILEDLATGGLTPIPGSEFMASPVSAEMSADGRFVSFVAQHVLLFDRQTNSTEIISQTPAQHDSSGTFFQTLVSSDGRYVAFTGEANDLVQGFVDGNGANGVDLYLRDRQLNETVLVNRQQGQTTTSANAGTDVSIYMSSDGLKVFFNTFANDLAPNDNNGSPNGSDIYVFDAANSTVSLVSTTTSGMATGIASSYTISADGRYVAFDSFAANIVPDVTLPSNSHSYVRDLLTGTTELVDHDADGSVPGSDATFPQITPDGRYVLFQDDGPFLTSPPLTTTSSNVYVRDMTTGQIQLVSAIPDGTNAGDERSSIELSNHIQISQNGRYVTFVSQATNLVDDFVDGNGPLNYDLFIRDLVLGTTDLVSRAQSGIASADRETPLTFAAPIPFNDGRVFFSSAASDLTLKADSNDLYDAFLANPFSAPNPTIDVPIVNVGGPAASYTAKLPPVVVLPQVAVGGASAAGGTLSLSVTAVGKKKPVDSLHLPSTSTIGTSSAPVFANGKISVQVQLSQTVTAADIQSFLRGMTFATKGKGLKTPNRTMTIRLTNATGDQSPVATQSIEVHSKNRRHQ